MEAAARGAQGRRTTIRTAAAVAAAQNGVVRSQTLEGWIRGNGVRRGSMCMGCLSPQHGIKSFINQIICAMMESASPEGWGRRQPAQEDRQEPVLEGNTH
jgi:hypothetical protein